MDDPGATTGSISRPGSVPGRRSPAAGRGHDRRAEVRPASGSSTQLRHPRVLRAPRQPNRRDQRQRLHDEHGQPVPRAEVQPVGPHRVAGPDVPGLQRVDPVRARAPRRPPPAGRRRAPRTVLGDVGRPRRPAGRGVRAGPARRARATPSGTAGTASARAGSGTANRFSWMPPLRSSSVCRPASSACTAADHSLSACTAAGYRPSSRAISIRCTSLVPSPISRILASR